jgi:uncharacterized coiled-coil protein SlyX
MRHVAMVVLACSVMATREATAQQPGRQHGDSSSMQAPMDRKMMAQMQEADARLDRLVTEMNRSSGSKKVEAMAAVINEMVMQRKQMRKHMMQMMEQRGKSTEGQKSQHHDTNP